MAEMPELVQLHRETNREDLEVIAVSLDLVSGGLGSTRHIGSFAKRREWDVTHFALEGDNSNLGELFGAGRSIPYTAVFRDGKLVDGHTGALGKEGFRELAGL